MAESSIHQNTRAKSRGVEGRASPSETEEKSSGRNDKSGLTRQSYAKPVMVTVTEERVPQMFGWDVTRGHGIPRNQMGGSGEPQGRYDLTSDMGVNITLTHISPSLPHHPAIIAQLLSLFFK